MIAADRKLRKRWKKQGLRFNSRVVQPWPVIIFPAASDPDIIALCFHRKPFPTDVDADRPPPVAVPRCIVSRALYFLSLCSGLRRDGDPQFQMDKASHRYGLPVVTLSLDIANSQEFGDILNPKVWKRSVDLACAGLVIGMLMGPPCETRSIARCCELVGARFAPRPLRNASHLWGCDDIKDRECQQVLIGNDVLRIALFLFAIVMSCGGTALIEHPALLNSAPAEAPAIWNLPDTRWLVDNGAVVITVDQCRYGALSKKNTMLLTRNAAPLWGLPCASSL